MIALIIGLVVGLVCTQVILYYYNLHNERSFYAEHLKWRTACLITRLREDDKRLIHAYPKLAQLRGEHGRGSDVPKDGKGA